MTAKPHDIGEPLLFSPADAAAKLRVSESIVKQAIRAGRLKAGNFMGSDRMVRITRDELQRFAREELK